MVRYNTIIKIIDSYVTKCPTIAEMKERLGLMSYDEQYSQLMSQGLLNPLEEKEYLSYKKGAEQVLETELDKEIYGKLVEKDKERLFQYGRRLFEGIPHNEPPVVDRDSFTEDTQYMLYGDEEELIFNEVGNIENKEILRQEKDIPNVSYAQTVSMNNYFDGDLQDLNKDIKHKEYLNKLSNQQRNSIKDIDSLINKTGLSQDTVLYRSGYWDIHLNVGDHSRGFKGYQSTTFQKEVAEDYKSTLDDSVEWYGMGNKPMIYKIYAPKGTKGIVANDNRFMNGFAEHEFVLARNTGFTVLSIDYENEIVEVILDG